MRIWRNTSDDYGWVSIILHWLMAMLVLSLFVLGVYMVGLSYYDTWYHDAPYIHKAVGMMVFALLLIRIAWRMMNPVPHIMGKPWEQTIARTVHHSHYILLLLIVVSGYLIPTAKGAGIDIFGVWTIPAIVQLPISDQSLGLLHQVAAWLIVLLTGMHAAAALKHHFIDRDMTLMRMLGCSYKHKEHEHEHEH